MLKQSIASLYIPVLGFLKSIFLFFLFSILLFIFLFFLIFFIKYPFYRKEFRDRFLYKIHIGFKPYNLLRWWIVDYLNRHQDSLIFKPYGFTIFVGRQGAGKTISMIKYLDDQKKKYPNCYIVTNFGYLHATHRMESWRDLLEIRNGEDGVIFAIDEIHSEYSTNAWKDFPEALLSEISQQRKQRIKIVATSQSFSRVVKQIREQAFSVIQCQTYFGRYTRNVEYDAEEYSSVESPYKAKKNLKPLWKTSFVQSNLLRQSYDTYEKIERMQKVDFIPRTER